MNTEKSVCGLFNEYGRVSFSGFTFCAAKGVSGYEFTITDIDSGDTFANQKFETEEQLILTFSSMLDHWARFYYLNKKIASKED